MRPKIEGDFTHREYIDEARRMKVFGDAHPCTRLLSGRLCSLVRSMPLGLLRRSIRFTMPVSVSTWIDRSCIRPYERGAKCAVAFELVATGTPVESAHTRAPSRTILALDISGSMNGEPLDQVIRSVDRLVDALSPDDEIGIVAFSSNASTVVSPVKVDASGKRLVRSRVSRLFSEGGTNIEAGLDLASSMLESTPTKMRRGVVLLSDGAPNVGAHTAEGLREVVRRHRPLVSFFSLGYGVDHCEEVLAAIGDSGGGGYEYVQDPASCMRSFARALGAQGDVVASGVELVLSLGDGVELVRFVGQEQVRFSREGILIALPDMVNGARRFIVAELLLREPPGGDRFVIDVVRAEARFRSPSSPASSKPETFAVDTTLEVADREPAVVVEAARRILLVRADQAREEARVHADRGQFPAAANVLRTLMREIEKLPDWVANDGSLLAEAYELLVDEAMAFERRPDAEQYAMFKKATHGSRLAASAPTSARSRGDASQKLIEHVAGDCPEAWVLVERGPGSPPQKHVLREECIIGRTADADIRVMSASVSRRHAEIFANAGDYWVTDLGSTNPTIVNGQPLQRAPHKLAPGDVIRVGEIELRYDEARRPSK